MTTPLDMEITSLLRNIEEKPKSKEELLISVQKIDLDKYHDSLVRISRVIPFNIIEYIENMDDEKVEQLLNLL